MSRGGRGGTPGAENVGSVLLQQQENLQLFELLGRKCVVRGWGGPVGCRGPRGGSVGHREGRGGASGVSGVPWGPGGVLGGPMGAKRAQRCW